LLFLGYGFGVRIVQVPDRIDFPIIREIMGERDRGAAIIAAGFLDSKLTEAIRACLRADKDTAQRLFKPTGPMGAFGNKALLGYMLKLYRKETLEDFLAIGEIRNRFAHIPEPMTFGATYVLERRQKLTLVKRVWSVIPDFPFPPRPLDEKSARTEYLETVSLATNFLHSQTNHANFRERSEELLPF
jgi:hypothetical protein